MNDRYFVDTNILVYANDPAEKTKQQIAQNIILDGIRKELIVISAQVLSEFYVTVTRKIQKAMDQKSALNEIKLLRHVEIMDIDFNLIIQAIRISQKHNLSYWDSLIISAAIHSKVNILYSEDLNHNQVIEGVRIINPFI